MKKFIYFLFLSLSFNGFAIAVSKSDWEREAEHYRNNGVWTAQGWVSNQELDRQRMNNPALYNGLCDSTVYSLSKVLNGRKLHQLSKDEITQVELFAVELKKCPAYAESAEIILAAVKQNR